MPAQEESHRCQFALYWAPGSLDRYGRPAVSSYEELAVRWEQSENEGIDADGNAVKVEGYLHVAVDLEVGGRVWLGTEDEWLGTGSGGTTSNVLYVHFFEKTPDINGREFERIAHLSKYKDTPD